MNENELIKKKTKDILIIELLFLLIFSCLIFISYITFYHLTDF